MSKALRIKTEELPLRARPLSPDEVSKVYGGCWNFKGAICMWSSDCCSPLHCYESGYITESLRMCNYIYDGQGNPLP